MDSMTSASSDKVVEDWREGEAAEYDFVRFSFCDIHGISRSKLVPRRHVNDTLKTGVGMCAGTLYRVVLNNKPLPNDKKSY